MPPPHFIVRIACRVNTSSKAKCQISQWHVKAPFPFLARNKVLRGGLNMKAKVSKLNNAYLTKKIEISQLNNRQSSSKLKLLK